MSAVCPRLRPAVFLDRDGVLNEVVRRGGRPESPRSLTELRICDDAPAAVARLQRSGFPIFVVSNQPDVARGRLGTGVLEALTAAIGAAVPVDAWRYCVHDDADACACRKPKPGMLLALAEEWGVDLERSYLVADSWKDMQAGSAAGCRTILLRRDYNVDATGGDEVRNLTEAADLILERSGANHARAYLDEASRVLEALDVSALEAMADALARLRERGGRLFFLGVGGGAGHASHAVCDFRKIGAIEAYAAAENVPELTARVNDDGWESVFAEYLRGSRLRSEDGVFVLSVGGGSAELGISGNLVRALMYAREIGATIFGVVGRDGGFTARVAEHCVIVPTVNPATVTPHTESMQALILHLLVTHPRVQRHAMKWESLSTART